MNGILKFARAALTICALYAFCILRKWELGAVLTILVLIVIVFEMVNERKRK